LRQGLAEAQATSSTLRQRESVLSATVDHLKADIASKTKAIIDCNGRIAGLVKSQEVSPPIIPHTRKLLITLKKELQAEIIENTLSLQKTQSNEKAAESHARERLVSGFSEQSTLLIILLGRSRLRICEKK